MKYLKLYEEIDFNEDDFDWIEEEPISGFKVGDMVIVTSKLYEKYPYWSGYFKDHLDKTEFEIGEIKDKYGKGEMLLCATLLPEYYYVPLDVLKKLERINEHIEDDWEDWEDEEIDLSDELFHKYRRKEFWIYRVKNISTNEIVCHEIKLYGLGERIGNVIPLTSREIDRIKNDKLEISSRGLIKYKKGGIKNQYPFFYSVGRLTYSEIKEKLELTDKNFVFMDKKKYDKVIKNDRISKPSEFRPIRGGHDFTIYEEIDFEDWDYEETDPDFNFDEFRIIDLFEWIGEDIDKTINLLNENMTNKRVSVSSELNEMIFGNVIIYEFYKSINFDKIINKYHDNYKVWEKVKKSSIFMNVRLKPDGTGTPMVLTDKIFIVKS